eukprot:COSAG02_NODE_1657_length_11467_cov_16.831281_7_plen_128_part_00
MPWSGRIAVLQLGEILWPMYQIQVDVVQLQVAQSLLQGRQHVLRLVLRVPQLGCDKKFFASNDSAAQRFRQNVAYLSLIGVPRSAVDVSVTELQGVSHRYAHFSRLHHTISAVGQSVCNEAPTIDEW